MLFHSGTHATSTFLHSPLLFIYYNQFTSGMFKQVSHCSKYRVPQFHMLVVAMTIQDVTVHLLFSMVANINDEISLQICIISATLQYSNNNQSLNSWISSLCQLIIKSFLYILARLWYKLTLSYVFCHSILRSHDLNHQSQNLEDMENYVHKSDLILSS